jgi:hypothetical protein
MQSDQFHVEFRVGLEYFAVTVDARNRELARRAAWDDARRALSSRDFDRAYIVRASCLIETIPAPQE